MPDQPINAARVACSLARNLEEHEHEYAIGGALALGYWAEARGTVDVDLILFVPQDKPSECVWILQEIGCEIQPASAIASLREHGFCRAQYEGCRVDVFLPSIDFYQQARRRRRRVKLRDTTVSIWDAESLCVFKMMFFRRKDIADIEQVLRTQKADLDREWVREHLVEIYGPRDPRISQWDELVSETGAAG